MQYYGHFFAVDAAWVPLRFRQVLGFLVETLRVSVVCNLLAHHLESVDDGNFKRAGTVLAVIDMAPAEVAAMMLNAKTPDAQSGDAV
jgi:hypothetical protein